MTGRYINSALFLVLILICIGITAYCIQMNSRNVFHRSKMIQYQYLNNLRNEGNNNIYTIMKNHPNTTKNNAGYLIPPSSVPSSEFVANEGADLIDFYGYLLVTDDSGTVVNAYLYKP